MLRLIFGERAAEGWILEERPEERARVDELRKHGILVAIRKCFLLLNEGVTAISIRDVVAIRLFAVVGEAVSIARLRVVDSLCMCLSSLHLITQAASLP